MTDYERPTNFRPRENYKRLTKKRHWNKTLNEAKTEKKKYCEWCGCDMPNLCIVHHLDCNPENDDLNNLMAMCGSCHSRYHTYFPNWQYLTDADIIHIIKVGLRIIDRSKLQSDIIDGRAVYGYEHALQSGWVGGRCDDCGDGNWVWRDAEALVMAKHHHEKTGHHTSVRFDKNIYFSQPYNLSSTKGRRKRKTDLVPLPEGRIVKLEEITDGRK